MFKKVTACFRAPAETPAPGSATYRPKSGTASSSTAKSSVTSTATVPATTPAPAVVPTTSVPKKTTKKSSTTKGTTIKNIEKDICVKCGAIKSEVETEIKSVETSVDNSIKNNTIVKDIEGIVEKSPAPTDSVPTVTQPTPLVPFTPTVQPVPVSTQTVKIQTEQKVDQTKQQDMEQIKKVASSELEHVEQKVSTVITEVKTKVESVLPVSKSTAPIVVSDEVKAFVAKMRPLDLVVFRGGDFVSKSIMDLEKRKTGCGEISHVAVVMSREWCSDIKPVEAPTSVTINDQTLFTWESIMSGPLSDGVYNAETDKSTFGIQFRVAEDVIQEYLTGGSTDVGYCELIQNPIDKLATESDSEYQARIATLKQKINAAYTAHDGQSYNANPFALLGCLYPSLRYLRTASKDVLDKFTAANKWLFCSEFVAVIYEAIGVLDSKIDTGDIAPVNFLGYEGNDSDMKPICKLPPTWVKPLDQPEQAGKEQTTSTAQPVVTKP